MYSANLLLENNFFVHSMFYLSQSFEKAIKSLLVILEEKNTTISESDIEQNLSRIGHDKKKMMKKVIDFLKQNNNNAEFEKIKEELNKSIKSYKHFESIELFKSQVKEDFCLNEKMKAPPTSQSAFLHKKYYERNSYKFRIIGYILRRYFNEIESNVRYPTQANSHTIHNAFNDNESKGPIKMLYKITSAFLDIVSHEITITK
jgi:HEPN domain-containing protein